MDNDIVGELTRNPETIQKLISISKSADKTLARRAKLLLAYAEGKQTFEAASISGISRGRARYWKREFLKKGLEIFSNKSVLISEVNETSHNIPVNFPETHLHVSEKSAEDTNRVIKKEKKEKRSNKKIKKNEYPELQFPQPMKQPGIKPDDTLGTAGKKVFRSQFAQLLQNETGSRSGDDIESLHDMRVATRRIRAAYNIFKGEYQKKHIKQYFIEIRKTGRLLGHVRDLDVLTENVKDYLKLMPEGRQSDLDPLLIEWQSQLDQARESLIAHLDSKDYSDFKNNFNYFIQTPEFALRLDKSETLIPKKVYAIVPYLIYSCLASVRGYGEVVNSATIPQLHALRIELKYFRYTMEFFLEVLGAEARQLIDLIKKLQDHLGELHDADVACQKIKIFLENWDKGDSELQLNFRRNPEPVVNYLGYQYAERHRLSISFPTAWAIFEKPEIRKMIALTVSTL